MQSETCANYYAQRNCDFCRLLSASVVSVLARVGSSVGFDNVQETPGQSSQVVGLADSCRLLLCKLAGWVGVWGFLLWKGSAVPQLDKVRRPPTALPVCSANGRAGLVPLSSLCWGLKTVREGQRGEENDFLHCPDWTQGGLPCQSAMPTGRAGVLPSSSPRWGLQTATGRGEEGCPD